MSTSMMADDHDRLSVPERLAPVHDIWDSLDESPDDLPLGEAHRNDLQRRLDAYRDDPKAGSFWDEVKARLEAIGE